MDYQREIDKFYRENPNISGAQILERLNLTEKRSIRVFWRELEKFQVSRRGLYPGIRKNTHAHAKSVKKGDVYFIPPKEKK